jgi:hypothetical protein
MKKRTEEQTRALLNWDMERESEFRTLCQMPGETQGLNEITVDSCFQNGRETAAEIGITIENGFFDWEVQRARDFFAWSAAKLYEII